jgi:hypothetical protein
MHASAHLSLQLSALHLQIDVPQLLFLSFNILTTLLQILHYFSNLQPYNHFYLRLWLFCILAVSGLMSLSPIFSCYPKFDVAINQLASDSDRPNQAFHVKPQQSLIYGDCNYILIASPIYTKCFISHFTHRVHCVFIFCLSQIHRTLFLYFFYRHDDLARMISLSFIWSLSAVSGVSGRRARWRRCNHDALSCIISTYDCRFQFIQYI